MDMDKILTASSGNMMCGYLHFNFYENYLVFDRSSAQLALFVTCNKKVPFSDITGIEYKAPGFMTGAQVKFIINNCRYCRDTNNPKSEIFIFNTDKKNLFNLNIGLKALSKEIGIPIQDKNKCSAELKKYSGEYDVTSDDSENISINNHEYRKRCNVCGHIFCYTQKDLDKNVSNAKSATLSSVAGVTTALGGAYAASAVNQSNAQNSMNKMVDYSRCPKCNSTNLSNISEEEFEKMKNENNSANQPVVSAADEIKKFKELLDIGAITQEEFDKKKKELLCL